VGLYVTGVLVRKMGFAWYLALLASIGVAALFGTILALPALRVTGPYLAMVTLAFGTIIQILINEMTWLTEEPMGITITKLRVFDHQVSAVQYYYMVMFFMVASLLVVHSLLKSDFGRAFEALRDSPIASDCMGFPCTATRSTLLSSAPVSPAWPAACTPARRSTFRPTRTTLS
jgi:ABC-type branched-subunit amino acid transport system permease subunit